MINEDRIAVARVGKLFGEARSGGVSLTLYEQFDDEFDPTTEPLFVEIDSLDVPLWCEKFERRGQRGATVHFADFDTPRRAEELLGKELYSRATSRAMSSIWRTLSVSASRPAAYKVRLLITTRAI